MSKMKAENNTRAQQLLPTGNKYVYQSQNKGRQEDTEIKTQCRTQLGQ